MVTDTESPGTASPGTESPGTASSGDEPDTDDAPWLEDDPGTSEEAVTRWARYVVIGVVVGIPLVTVLLALAIQAISDADTSESFVIALWTALWGGLFAGGTAGAMAYAARHSDH